MTYKRLEGAGTALITPFTSNNKVDYEGLNNLIDQQIEGKMAFTLLLGTTGETPTLSKKEKYHIMTSGIQHVAGRIPVMVGTGTNCTRTTIEETQKAQEAGVDYVLIVTPYYNKPEQDGIYQHFKTVHDNTDTPIVLYNIAGRTGRNIETATLERLANLDRIVGVKEASGDRDQIRDVCRMAKKYSGFSVLSGDDALTPFVLNSGGRGLVSVVGNLVPGKVAEMVHYGLCESSDIMCETYTEILPLMDAAFLESNPQPIKYMMNRVGLPAGGLRSPLIEVREETKQKLDEVLRDLGLLLGD